MISLLQGGMHYPDDSTSSLKNSLSGLPFNFFYELFPNVGVKIFVFGGIKFHICSPWILMLGLRLLGKEKRADKCIFESH